MVLNEYNIFDKIVGIVTDNCSNMINLSSILNSDVHPEPRTSLSQMRKKVYQFSCCAHVLNLILQRMSKYSNEKECETQNRGDENFLSDIEAERMQNYASLIEKCRKIVMNTYLKLRYYLISSSIN
ncbi:hypothetical protein BpHYR1_029536 [Brachionus plicatilis]|uniref:DUF659 domain-containing protein n=1 Tax=Brachionus plicatilis TaxID=10195 RepID=A0A3M7P4W7_BRAPC|nr:hypothetical protein BpHYR1_029536 [Brachionus plicatilis]